MSPHPNLKPKLGKRKKNVLLCPPLTPAPANELFPAFVLQLRWTTRLGLTSGVGGAEGSVLCPSCLASEALLHPAVAIAAQSRSGAGGEMASQPPPPPKPWETRRIPGAGPGPGPGPTFQ